MIEFKQIIGKKTCELNPNAKLRIFYAKSLDIVSEKIFFQYVSFRSIVSMHSYYSMVGF